MAATSSAEAARPSGHVDQAGVVRALALVPRRSPSASISPSAIGVLTQPGATQFARTPSGPWSTAMHCVSICSPAFDEQYASDSGLARRPAAEETRDDRAAALDEMVDRRASHQERAGEVRARARRPTCSGSRSRSDPSPPIPALQTSASSPPNRSRRLRDGALGVLGHRGVGDDREAVDLGRDRLDRRGAPTGHRDRVPVRRQASRDPPPRCPFPRP